MYFMHVFQDRQLKRVGGGRAGGGWYNFKMKYVKSSFRFVSLIINSYIAIDNLRNEINFNSFIPLDTCVCTCIVLSYLLSYLTPV